MVKRSGLSKSIDAQIKQIKNDSELCQAFERFKKDFAQHAMATAIFNPLDLLNAIKVLNQLISPISFLARYLFWCQGFGFIQRFLPICYQQAFMQGIENLVSQRCRDKLQRDRSFASLEKDNYRLGNDFAVYSFGIGCNPRKEISPVTKSHRLNFKLYLKLKSHACKNYALAAETGLSERVRRLFR